MSKVFVLIAALSYLLRGDCFEFYVARDLSSTKELPKNIWSRVEVLGIEDTQTDNIKAKVSIPDTVSYSDVSIFFANDAKQMLEVQLKGVVKGTFYSKPHKVTKEVKAGETETVKRDNYVEISGDFPRSWLPVKPTKISATVKTTDGKHYNYYGVQNSMLSITDLMVVEEFKQLTS